MNETPEFDGKGGYSLWINVGSGATTQEASRPFFVGFPGGPDSSGPLRPAPNPSGQAAPP